MRNIAKTLCTRCCALALMVSPLPGAARTDAVPSPAVGGAVIGVHPASPIVTVRMSDNLGQAVSTIQSAVSRFDFVRVDPDGDYELTTKPDFPLTLILVDRRAPRADWELTPESEGQSYADRHRPWTVDLGNLVLNDYAATLDKTLRTIGRAKALLALQSPKDRPRTSTCLRHDDAVIGDPCYQHTLTVVEDSEPRSDPTLYPDTAISLFVTNTQTKARYAYVFDIDSRNRIRRLTLADGPLIPPGTTVQTSGVYTFDTNGYHRIVTLSSDTEIPDDVLTQKEFDTDASERCPGALGARLCGARIDTEGSDDGGWSAAVAEYVVLRAKVKLIGGGHSAVAGMAPWMAALYSTVPYTEHEVAVDDGKGPGTKEFLRVRTTAERNHRCGGTLIAPQIVLTAAHCVAKDAFAGKLAIGVLNTRRIRVGTFRLGSGGSTFAIDGVAVHAGYSPGQQPNDLALLLLKPDRGTGQIVTAQANLPAPAAPLMANSPVTAFGWGYTGVVAPNARALFSENLLQRNPKILQFGTLQALGWQTCRQRVGNILVSGMLCAVPPTDTVTGRAPRNVFSCVGDSGGPLVRGTGNGATIFGLASWSMGCGYASFPSVYTDVRHYTGWITGAEKLLRSGTVVWVSADGQSVTTSVSRSH